VNLLPSSANSRFSQFAKALSATMNEMTPRSPLRTVETPLLFFKADEKFKYEKPYTFKFDAPNDKVDHTNMEDEMIHGISVTDMRGIEKSFTIETNGFAVFDVDCELAYEDYFDSTKLQVYFRHMELLLKDHLGARTVQVFRHCIRKRDLTWPKASDVPHEYEQPTTVAHIDATLDESRREVRLQHGEKAEDMMKTRFQWLNFWKPLKGPMNDWPLLVCDAATVDKNKDITNSDLIYPDHAAENMQVYYRPGYKWYFLSDHKTSEVVVFKQTDSLPTACAGVPHCSFASPLRMKDEAPRESIEVRVLAYYNK